MNTELYPPAENSFNFSHFSPIIADEHESDTHITGQIKQVELPQKVSWCDYITPFNLLLICVLPAVLPFLLFILFLAAISLLALAPLLIFSPIALCFPDARAFLLDSWNCGLAYSEALRQKLFSCCQAKKSDMCSSNPKVTEINKKGLECPSESGFVNCLKKYLDLLKDNSPKNVDTVAIILFLISSPLLYVLAVPFMVFIIGSMLFITCLLFIIPIIFILMIPMLTTSSLSVAFYLSIKLPWRSYIQSSDDKMIVR